MWLKDIYYNWRKRRIKKQKNRWWWETAEKHVGDEDAEAVAEFYNKVKGICPYCSKSFDMPGTLRRHILTEHPGNIDEDERRRACKIKRKRDKGE